ncbi:MAG TPA: ATP-binding protein [Candidatus Dormibacteraeota bacterium]|nr:ATP-binding protein [Candidatus Dormibacteraeota bacterium]
MATTAALTGSLAFIRSRRALEKETRRRLTVAARTIADHLHADIEERWTEVSSWAHLEVMRALLYRDVDKQLAQFLDQMLADRPAYRALVARDARGTLVASAGQLTPLSAAPQAGAFTMLAAGAGREPLLCMDAAVPDPDRPHDAAGWLSATLDAQPLLDSVADLTRTAGRHVALTLRVAGGVELARVGAPSAEGADLLAVERQLAPLEGLNGLDLEIRVEEPRDVALEPLHAAGKALWNIAALALVVGSALGGLMAWRIAAPIRELTAAARTISERGRIDMDLRLPEGRGEVGVLARAFRHMLESLDAARARAVSQERLAFLGEIAANLAHEVRTPLSVLKASAQLIARGGLPAAERERLAANVTAEVDRVNGIVTDLVDLARPRPIHYRVESVSDVIERAVGICAAAARHAGVRIRYARPAEACAIRGSADQLHQVMLNLTQNALQAMNGPGELTLAYRRDGGWVEITCADNGPGIPPEVEPRLFSPFCTSKSDGTGLGLAIARRIVEEHGGTITGANRPTGGACFTVRLPACAEGA